MIDGEILLHSNVSGCNSTLSLCLCQLTDRSEASATLFKSAPYLLRGVLALVSIYTFLEPFILHRPFSTTQPQQRHLSVQTKYDYVYTHAAIIIYCE